MGQFAPIVGRATERVLLQEQLATAAEGHGRLVILGGEAGIGKSTLSRDLAAIARHRGFRVLVGASYDLMAAPPYGLWLEFGDAYRHALAGNDAPAFPESLTPQGLERIHSQAALFAEVMEFLRQLTEDGPVLIVLEDAHWSDPVSLELLRHVAAHLEGLPLLLVVTYRVDELTRQSPFYQHLPALARDADGLRLDLKRLGHGDLGDLVTLRYGLPPASAEPVVDYLDARSEGNPFFAVELLRTLEENGGLARRETGWVAGPLDGVAVPNLVKQVIDGRVDRLGAEMRESLAVAAVIGQDVDLDLWQAVTGLPDAAMLATIERAVEVSLVQALRDGARVRFAHALTRETLYEGILPMRRRAIHRRVAEVLQAARLPDPDPIAYHLQQAGDAAAPEWLIAAGERAQRAYAWLTARDRFLAAADLLEGVAGEELTRARLLYRCGRLLRYADAASGIAHLQLATRLAELAGDPVLTADADYSTGLLRCFADEWAVGVKQEAAGIAALEALPPEQARLSWSTVNWMADALPVIDLPIASDIDPAAEQLTALGLNHRRGGLPWFLAASGQLREAAMMATGFLGHVSGLGVGPLVLSASGHAQFGLGIARTSLGNPQGARAAFAAARDIYGRLDHHAVIAFTLLTELTDVYVPWYTADVAAWHRLAREAEDALGRAGGALPSDVSARRAQLVPMHLDGRWREARAIAGETDRHGNYLLRRQVTRAIGPIALHQGDGEEAWRQVLAILPAGPDAVPGSAVLLDALLMLEVAIDLCLAAGDVDAARIWLDAHDRWLTWSGSALGPVEHALAEAKIADAAGDHAAAEFHARRAMAMAASPPQPLALLRARRFLGETLGRTGRGDEARSEVTASLELAGACGLPYERALGQVALAALTIGTPGDAPALLQEARATLAGLGAAPALARADALAARLAPGAAPMTDGQSGLTARELEVLRLVAHGLTDAEVGERLFISPRTVSHHLQSIYGKLGVRSRAGATRYAIENDIT